MKPKEKKSIWFPFFVFENSQNKLESIVDKKSLITVYRKGQGKEVDSTVTENKLLYKGSENPIHYERLYNEELVCHYELAWYPFDKQKCSIAIEPTEDLRNYIDLIPDKFEYTGPVDLTQYSVMTVEMKMMNSTERKLVVVEVTIRRMLMSIILTAMLPTILLNLIGHTANYFKPFFFEAIISLNVTVMLVLTNMFINITNTMPKTAYIKMIDFWLIFNLLKPFTDIIMQTYIESLRVEEEEGREINKHGKKIQVAPDSASHDILDSKNLKYVTKGRVKTRSRSIVPPVKPMNNHTIIYSLDPTCFHLFLPGPTFSSI